MCKYFPYSLGTCRDILHWLESRSLGHVLLNKNTRLFFCMFLLRYKEYILTNILGEWTTSNKGLVKVSPSLNQTYLI